MYIHCFRTDLCIPLTLYTHSYTDSIMNIYTQWLAGLETCIKERERGGWGERRQTWEQDPLMKSSILAPALGKVASRRLTATERATPVERSGLIPWETGQGSPWMSPIRSVRFMSIVCSGRRNLERHRHRDQRVTNTLQRLRHAYSETSEKGPSLLR